MVDVLATLQEASWRGIPFPVVSLDEQGSQSMPQHKAADRDGAFVEGTGRNPFVYSLRAPLFAGTVARGATETWTDLYPGTFLRLRAAWSDRSTGTLVHPLYGAIQCKPAEWKAALNADERGGQSVDITFIETRDDGVTPAFSTREGSFAQTVAADLDSQLATLNPAPVVFTANDDATSFLDVVLQLSRIVDGTTLQAQQAIAKVDQTIAKLDKLSGSIDRAADVLSVDPVTGLTKSLGRLGPGSGRIWTNTQALRSTLVDVRLRLGTSTSRAVRTFLVDRPTMLVIIASRLTNTTAEILALNPTVSRARVTIPAQTLIRYFE